MAQLFRVCPKTCYLALFVQTGIISGIENFGNFAFFDEVDKTVTIEWTMPRREYKSSEKVEFSSSEDESPASPTLIERSPSPSSSVSSSSPGPTSSPQFSSSKSPSRTPTPDPSSYHYIPPSTHELSTSKEKSALPNLQTNEELYLLRIPKGVELKDIQFHFRKRKAKIGEEEWKLLDENTGDIRIIQPMENSEKFEFSMSSNCAN